MRWIIGITILVMSLPLTSCAKEESFNGKKEKNVSVSNAKNRLAQEKSPYLLQHADNPVDWYPWGEEAFKKAKAENKPVFLSIGYSTCHWCHVMEHESFENPQIAAVLNKNFVSIKVDREERPDIDNVYMTVVTSLTGSGGWPLSVFLTPDKRPFFGGTYFPPEPRWGQPGFYDLLMSITETWQTKRNEVINSSRAITEAIRKQSVSAGQTRELSLATLDRAYQNFASAFDSRHGGFGSAPKFPTGHNLAFLLRYWKRTGDRNALDMVEKTLDEMAKGGMYDQLGGGFHRYSTDQTWFVPHFEKMLYDQAILSRIYLEAYQATGKPRYANIAREIFDYVLREMRDKQGGFYSAEDADSLEPEGTEKKEGAFYVWGYAEIVKILGQARADVFCYFFGVEPKGNVGQDPHGEFTGKNILAVTNSVKETAERFGKSVEETESIIRDGKEKLLAARAQRPRPHLDDKVLADWNGLMIASLAFGARVLDEPVYREAAEAAAQFIFKNFTAKDGRFLHRYRDGEAGILATIEDYAFFTHGLIDLYEATWTTDYLQRAIDLTKEMILLFEDSDQGGFFFTANDAEALILRQKEIFDGALPSGNSVAALNLLRLTHITLQTDLEKKVRELFNHFAPQVERAPHGHSQLLIALDFALGPAQEIVIAGQGGDQVTQAMFKSLYRHFLPNKVVLFRPALDKEAEEIIRIASFVEYQKALEGKTTAYVCENYQCKYPTTDLDRFEKLLRGEEAF